MRKLALRVLAGSALALLPLAASAQTSAIAGEVKDASGAVLPGVTVEVTSPALIEKVRTTTTDDSGRYAITNLRPGTYSITFGLPGFNTVQRDGIILESDFTAPINAEMRVGAIEETITVAAESPVVDVQSITARIVMTRDVLDAMPTGRNIQAVGIMIPGTSLSLGGGGALSRDVGGSGNLQQSPLQYRGSNDTVQTVEGMRLNNLCAQGQFSGVYWNDNSFQEISYVTGADSAEMGQGGMRVNMVPRDGGNSFRGSVFGNYAGESFASDNCQAPGLNQPCAKSKLSGDLTYNPNNRLTNVSNIQKIWDFNPVIGGPIKRDRLWFNYTFRHYGVEKTVADSYYDTDPSPYSYVADLNRPAVDDGHIVSNAGRLSIQASAKDKISWYHDHQRKYRDHWGVSANTPPEAAAIQVTPTSFVDVTKWTRTHTNRLLLEAGLGIYDQEYTEIYQPEVTGVTDKVFDLGVIRSSKVYTLCDNSTGNCQLTQGKISGAWPNPADHFSLLRNVMGAASYVTGTHAFRAGVSFVNGNWRLVSQRTGDAQPIEYSGGTATAVTLRLPTDRRNGIRTDLGIFAQDRWTMNRITLNLGIRFDQFVGESQPSDVLPSRIPGTLSAGRHYDDCPDGINDAKAGCTGRVQNWKDVSPRVGFSWDVFGDGKTAIKASVARYVAGQNIAVADDVNPVSALGITDRRPWTDLDNNRLPYDAAGNFQLNELAASTATATFGTNTSTTSYAPDVLDGWFKRGFNMEYTIAAQHEVMDRVSLNGGYFRRTFGNQTFTDNLSINPSDYDGPFCITAPTNPNLPDGGGYQVCGLYDLKQSVQDEFTTRTRITNNLIRFSDDFGGETNLYQGFDVNLDARFANGAFLRGGIGAGARTFDNCNLLQAGYNDAMIAANTFASSEIYPDGTTYCHREYKFRPDAKVSGNYLLPFDILISGAFQFSRGVQTGGAGPSLLATWSIPRTNFAPNTPLNGHNLQSTLGRALNTGSANKSVQLMREGLDYGRDNLHQLDLRLSKRFRFGRYRARADFDLYNVFNDNWPYTRNAAFSNSGTPPTPSAWLRPTNVLQQRFFKIGANIDF